MSTAREQPDPRATLRGGLPDQYLTPDDIATLLKVPKETVYQWRKKHTGPPSFRIGKHVRYDPAVVHAYIAQTMAADRTAA
ncbi:helix-turn-helix transcriptional regulator [Streptomyces sp. WI04-05B]|uniref:helix-turn-helix transcriptional regulator n=1 Tax=Streptomyces TaxID=1883 RepID=UPI0029AE5B35|nr:MULTISPECIES: helix-turn-helix domain-containing protein [unclassified Streptomyces]MDX2541951.1 helix-turn-helix domain-containing protein [Streptomyces sp. WI04-05B]MDX2587033.1 helix-turn-helix domain-containing protein [Streptomyces sp. WI04-05A]